MGFDERKREEWKRAVQCICEVCEVQSKCDNLHADEALADFKKKNPKVVSHIKAGRGETEDDNINPMSDNEHSPSLLPYILGTNLPPEVRQLFLNWWPTVPSSWTTPPESEGEDTTISTGSSPIRWDYYQPQTLIPTNLSLHAVHTPYTTDHPLPTNTSNHSSEDSFPCPTPELANPILPTNTDPILILPWPHLEDKHALGPQHLDSGFQDPRSPLPLHHSSPLSQEAQEVQHDTRGAISPGANSFDDQANKWVDANQATTWEDYGPRPQVPPGYVLNDGVDYISFNIHLPSGEFKPAKYIKIEWGKDPLIYGMIDGNPHQYVESFQAMPFPSARPLHTYTSNQLEFFKCDHDLWPEIDDAVVQLHNWSATAKVGCYWENKKKLKRDYEELWQVQHDIWKRELTLGGCAQCMAGAWILQCIEVINQSKMQLLMEEYKQHCCGCRS